MVTYVHLAFLSILSLGSVSVRREAAQAKFTIPTTFKPAVLESPLLSIDELLHLQKTIGFESKPTIKSPVITSTPPNKSAPVVQKSSTYNDDLAQDKYVEDGQRIFGELEQKKLKQLQIEKQSLSIW